MSERREKMYRYHERVRYVRRFELWLHNEPPMILFWRWRAWKKRRPKWED